MKKICALLVVSLLLTSGSAFAAASGLIPAGQVLTAANAASTPTYTLPSFAKLSTGVSLGFKTDTATYAIITKHVNGDNEYGAAANDGKNYYNPLAPGSAADTPTTSDSQSFSTWSSL